MQKQKGESNVSYFWFVGTFKSDGITFNDNVITIFYHILVDDKAKSLPCNKTLSFV